MNPIFARNTLLLGPDRFNQLQQARVAVFGLGGVGGTAAEGFVRSGVGHLSLIDFDRVDPSNLNRQILFTQAEIGQLKTEAARHRFMGINPEADIALISEAVDASFFQKHDFQGFDYLVDAIDDIPAKMALAQYALAHQIPFISCLGMANRLNPALVKVSVLEKTQNDPLAKKMRSLYRHEGIDLKRVPVVCSEETPLVKGATPASMMMVPSEAGLLIDSVVILSLAKIVQED